MIEEMKKAKVDLLGITEIKKKGKGATRIPRGKKGYILLYSGVTEDRIASGGVGFLFSEAMKAIVREWRFVDDRIMVVELEEGNGLLTIIVAYGLNDNAITSEKEWFFDKLQKELVDAKGTPFVMGDLNDRVGKHTNMWPDILGRHGEKLRNDNGETILNLCAANEIVVGNSKFQHKEAHKFTREQPSRNEKSIIDYFLFKREVIDVWVKRGFEINSDHYLLKLDKTWKADSGRDRKRKRREEKKRVIKSYGLEEEVIAMYYGEEIERRVKDEDYHWDSEEVETSWQNIKKIMLEAAGLVSGTKKVGSKGKKTAWWTDEIKEVVKEKKLAWKEYLRNKSQENYDRYRCKKIIVKNKVIEAKRRTWEDFGEKMEADFKENQKLFYRVIKSLRKDKAPVLKFIKDKRGNILTNNE